jgi:hypothetical protein
MNEEEIGLESTVPPSEPSVAQVKSWHRRYWRKIKIMNVIRELKDEG